MQVTHVVLRNGKAQGFNRNIFIRSYGSSFSSKKAIDIFSDDSTVTVSFNDGTVQQFDKHKGIVIRSL